MVSCELSYSYLTNNRGYHGHQLLAELAAGVGDAVPCVALALQPHLPALVAALPPAPLLGILITRCQQQCGDQDDMSVGKHNGQLSVQESRICFITQHFINPSLGILLSPNMNVPSQISK